MFKEFLMEQALKSQLKDVPENQREMILKIVEKNPDFFISLAKEIEEETKKGKDQMTSAMEVFKRRKNEIRSVLNK